jgi:hypothetical protein
MKESSRLKQKCKRSLFIPSDFGNRLSKQLMLINVCDINENGGFVNCILIKNVKEKSKVKRGRNPKISHKMIML